MTNKKTLSANQMALLLTLVYCASYVTRINFAAIIQEIITDTGFAKSALSVIPVCLSVTYGTGQVVNGFISDRIRPQSMILCGLCVVTLINLLFPFFAASIPVMCVLWAINGFAQAMMWPPIVQILVRSTEGATYNRCMVWVSCGSSIGTILVYLTAPALLSVIGWRGIFLLCAAFSLVATAIFALFQGRICLPPLAPAAPEDQARHSLSLPRAALLPVLFIGLGIIFQGMLRDGVTTWMPTYLVEVFSFENSTSILATVSLAVFSMLSFYFFSWFYERFFKNEVRCASVIYLMVILTGSLLSVFWQANTVLSITLLVLLCSAAHGVNLMLITHVPKRFKRYGNISAISGCLNACTYVGSAISTYGVALLVERKGWQFTIGSWVVIGALGLIACAIATRPWWKFFRVNSNNQ